MGDFETLKKKRSSNLGQLNQVIKFIEAFDEQTGAIGALKLKIDRILDLQTRNTNYHDDILEFISEDDMEIHELALTEFNKCCFEAILLATQRQERMAEQIAIEFPPKQENQYSKVPPLTVKSFSGDKALEWMNFKERFMITFGKFDDLTKLLRLNDALTAGALRHIQSLTLEAANFKVAWDLLCKKYENRPHLVSTVVAQLLLLPTLRRECGDDLSELLDSVTLKIASLKSLDVPTEHWDAIIIGLVAAKLDKLTRTYWETEIPVDGNMPTWQLMKDKLQCRARVLTTMADNTEKIVLNTKEVIYEKQCKSVSKVFATTNLATCVCCKGDHKVVRCFKFQGLSIAEKFEVLKIHRLCFKCFGSNHGANDCRAEGCDLCSRLHHKMLHMDLNSKSEPKITMESNNYVHQKEGQGSSFCSLITNQQLNLHLGKFFVLEGCDPGDVPKEQEICENLFQESTSGDTDGRFVVKIPTKDKIFAQGNTKYIAANQLKSQLLRLDRDASLQEHHQNLMHDSGKVGNIEEVPLEQLNIVPNNYVPHHEVLREDSSTTKVRVLFNGSQLSRCEESMNNLNYSGIIPDDLVNVVIRFRMMRQVFAADVVKMYRQIWVHSNYQDLQRILWKRHGESQLKTFRLKTVTCSTASAPFLATREFKQLAKVNVVYFSLASKAILSNTYVDDVLSGHDDLMVAVKTQRELRDKLATAKIELHKWCGTDVELLEHLTLEDLEQSQLEELAGGRATIKALEVCCNHRSDAFGFAWKSILGDNLTKRLVLSEISTNFNPLGLISPVIFKLKIFIQGLWDDKLSNATQENWRVLCEDMKRLMLNKTKVATVCATTISRFELASAQLLGFTISTNSMVMLGWLMKWVFMLLFANIEEHLELDHVRGHYGGESTKGENVQACDVAQADLH